MGAGGGLAVEALEMAMPSASGLWIFVAALVGLWGGGAGLEAAKRRKGRSEARLGAGVAMQVASLGTMPSGLLGLLGMSPSGPGWDLGLAVGALAGSAVALAAGMMWMWLLGGIDQARLERLEKKLRPLQESVERERRAHTEAKGKDAELLAAAERGDATEAARLLAEGADPNARGADGESPLHRGAKSGSSGHEAVVRELLKAGADPGERSWACGRTALIEACAHGGSPMVAEALAMAGAETEAMDLDGMTPLGAAVLAGEREMAEALLRRGADPNGPFEDGVLPLQAAVSGRGRGGGCVLSLVLAGADPSRRGALGKSALRMARESRGGGSEAGADLLAMAMAARERGKLEKACGGPGAGERIAEIRGRRGL